MFELSLNTHQRPTLSPLLAESLAVLALPLPELNQQLIALAERNPFLEVLEWPQVTPSAGDEPADRRAPSLEEAAIQQLRLAGLETNQFRASLLLLGHLDSRGLLTDPVERLADGYGIPLGVLEAARQVLLGLDPPGLAARDPREALLAALRQRAARATRNRAIGWAMDLLEHHSQLLAARRYGALARVLGGQEPLAAALAVLRTLPPYPAAAFEPPTPGVLFPDFVAEPHGSMMTIRLNREGLVGLSYGTPGSGECARHPDGISSRQRAAVRAWIAETRLIRYALRRREDTLSRLASWLAQKQAGFLADGRKKLVPLTMEAAGQALGLDPSTISRAVQGKTLATPHGSYPLKDLFAPNALRAMGAAVAASREQIKAAIAYWRKADPSLSDQALQERLAREGVLVSRRTIAKYRRELGLFPSRWVR